MVVAVGDKVEVFCRYCPWSGSDKFMVCRTIVGGTINPRIGRSDGWVVGTVIELADRNPLHALLAPNDAAEVITEPQRGSWARVQFADKIWVDNKGVVLDEKSLFQWTSIHSGNLRLVASAAPPQLSVLCVRWGGAVPIDDKRFDFAVSDQLIQEAMDALHAKHSKAIEVFTVWITCTADLDRVSEIWAAEALSRGTHRVGLYFLWGCNNDSKPGYVLSEHLVALMERMESTGIVTRYPNHSSLYRTITSKEYQPLLCSNRNLGIPPTVSVPSSKFHANPIACATESLSVLSRVKASVWNDPTPVTNGVVKVGFEWMGDGVRAFSDASDLRVKAQALLSGVHGRPRSLIVQERIPNVVCEPRVFVYNGKTQGIRYTWNEKEDSRTGRIHALRTCPQSRAAEERFGGDRKAVEFVEAKIAELVAEWNTWLLSACGEVPSFVRMDFLVEEVIGAEGGDKYRVWTCELGEIGSSMVGFREGRDMLFAAVADSCVPVASPTVLRRPTRPPPTL